MLHVLAFYFAAGSGKSSADIPLHGRVFRVHASMRGTLDCLWLLHFLIPLKPAARWGKESLVSELIHLGQWWDAGGESN